MAGSLWRSIGMNHRKKWLARFALLIMSGGFVWYGAARGEMGTVLNKAVNICFECIGLG